MQDTEVERTLSSTFFEFVTQGWTSQLLAIMSFRQFLAMKMFLSLSPPPPPPPPHDCDMVGQWLRGNHHSPSPPLSSHQTESTPFSLTTPAQAPASDNQVMYTISLGTCGFLHSCGHCLYWCISFSVLWQCVVFEADENCPNLLKITFALKGKTQTQYGNSPHTVSFLAHPENTEVNILGKIRQFGPEAVL